MVAPELSLIDDRWSYLFCFWVLPSPTTGYVNSRYFIRYVNFVASPGVCVILVVSLCRLFNFSIVPTNVEWILKIVSFHGWFRFLFICCCFTTRTTEKEKTIEEQEPSSSMATAQRRPPRRRRRKVETSRWWQKEPPSSPSLVIVIIHFIVTRWNRDGIYRQLLQRSVRKLHAAL